MTANQLVEASALAETDGLSLAGYELLRDTDIVRPTCRVTSGLVGVT